MALQPTDRLTILQPHVQVGDPHVLSDDRSRLSLLAAMYEALVYRDRTGAYRPALAESWTVAGDARTWTFNLRPHVSFHNGDTLEANDVVATLERIRDPEMDGELGTQGVFQSYLQGAVLKSLDEYTFQIVTPEPIADLLDLLVDMPIVSRRAMDGLPDTPVGSGPYRLLEARASFAIMEAFSQFWAGQPPVEQVYWQAEPDAQQRVARLLVGDADLVAEVPPESRRAIEASAQAEVVTSQSSVCATFMCNLQSGVCVDKRVRQALNYALDMPEIIATVMHGAARPLNGPLTSLHFGYDPSTPAYPYDPNKAHALLAEAGYSNGLRLVLDVPTTLPDEAPRLAQCMAEQYARVGITTEIKEFSDRPAYANMVRVKQIDDAACFDSSPLSTYRVLCEKFHSGAHGPWWQGYSNPEVDTLIDRAQVMTDDQRRQGLYRRTYRIIRDDAPWIFLYNPTLIWGTGPRARGWSPGVDGLVRLMK